MINDPKKISMFIAGAQKAGTTSLKNYLAQHPQIGTHTQEEILYFNNDRDYKLGYEYAFRRYFGSLEEDQVLLAKHVRVLTSLKAMQRLYAHNPHVTLILVLRNPVERAYSSFWFARQMGWENLETFEEAVWSDPRHLTDPLARSECAYLEDGIYCNHLERLFQVFAREQVLVFLFDEFKRDPQSICSTIVGKMSLPPFEIATGNRYNEMMAARFPALARIIFQPSRFQKARRIFRVLAPVRYRDWIVESFMGANKKPATIPPLSAEMKAALIKYFVPYNLELGRLLGRDLSDWNT